MVRRMVWESPAKTVIGLGFLCIDASAIDLILNRAVFETKGTAGPDQRRSNLARRPVRPLGAAMIYVG